MARYGVKAALVVVAMAAGIAGCGSASKSASGTTASDTSSVSSTPTITGTAPSPPATSAASSASSAPSSFVPPTTGSTGPPDFAYHGSDRDVCPWVKAGDLAKATQHVFATITVAASNGITTCQFGAPALTAGQTELPLACTVMFAKGPGASTSSYFDEVVANNGGAAQPVSGLGVEAKYAGTDLFVLTKHGVAVISCANGQGDSQGWDVAAFHAAEHSF